MNFWVPGDPKAQPRPTFTRFGCTNKNTKRDNATIPWRESIRSALCENFRFGFENYDSAAYCISLWFQFKRPKAHFRTGKYSHILKDSAPELHTQKPDVDNLAKLIMDEAENHNKELEPYEELLLEELKLNRIYKNDSQICKLVSMKTWTIDPGCVVSITQVESLEDLLRNTSFAD